MNLKQCTGPCDMSLPLKDFSPKQSRCKSCLNAKRRQQGLSNSQRLQAREANRKYKQSAKYKDSKKELYSKRQRLALLESKLSEYKELAARNSSELAVCDRVGFIRFERLRGEIKSEAEELKALRADDLRTDSEKAGKTHNYPESRESPDVIIEGLTDSLDKFYSIKIAEFEQWAKDNPKPFPNLPTRVFEFELHLDCKYRTMEDYEVEFANMRYASMKGNDSWDIEPLDLRLLPDWEDLPKVQANENWYREGQRLAKQKAADQMPPDCDFL